MARSESEEHRESAGLKLHFIQPGIVHQVWHYIKPGLEDTLQMASEGWTPDIVYEHLCKAGLSLLIAIRNNEEFIGHMIFNLRPTPEGLDFSIFSWHGHSMKPLWPDLLEYARSLGAVSMSFGTTRRGFERNPYGFEVDRVFYRRSL